MLKTTLFAALLAALPFSAAPAGSEAGAPVLAGTAPAAALDEVDDLIADGRRLLDLKKPSDAEGVFLQAAEIDGNSFRTRMWVLRARMDQGGQNNDTLDELDEIQGAGHDGPDLDYLYGMAFARRAEEQLSANALQAIDMNFGSAIELLGRATEVDPDRYRDAFLPLARAAWYQGQLETARAAAEEALRRYPKDPEAAFQLARIALSQFTLAKDDPELVSESERHWETARDGFAKAIVLTGKPNKKDYRGQSLLGQAYLQFGHTLMWKNQVKEAKKAYTSALAWNPESVDLGQLMGMLGASDLNDVLEKASPEFAKRYGEDDPRDGAMLWWLGYTRFAERRSKESEEAFLAALQKAPAFANAWHYVAMARYDNKDYGGAVGAVLAGWEIDPSALVAEMQHNKELNLAKLEYVISWCVKRNRWAEAAVLAELCAETAVDVARYWNNLGFFLREDAIRVAQRASADEAALARDIFEESLRHYRRALDLEPDDPTYLNDTAVVLHYYLERDLDEAMRLYDRAAEIAEARLAAGDLSPEEEDLTRTALRDATNNRRALRKLLDERAEG